MKKVLVAGATGYLGQYLVKELKKRGFWVRVLIRKESQKFNFESVDDYFIGEVTKPESIHEVTKDIDWVFSTIGITRQKDGLTYMDVDYQGNSNLLKEALKEKVESQGMRHLFRYSGTENKIRLLLEGKDEEKLEEMMDECVSFFKGALV